MRSRKEAGAQRPGQGKESACPNVLRTFPAGSTTQPNTPRSAISVNSLGRMVTCKSSTSRDRVSSAALTRSRSSICWFWIWRKTTQTPPPNPISSRVLTSSDHNTSRTRRLCSRVRRGRQRGTLRTGIVVSDTVAHPAHCLEQLDRILVVDLAPQVVDVDLDQRGTGAEIGIPHMLDNLIAGEDLAGVAHQQLQQAVFGGRQVDGPPVPPRTLGHSVK